MQEEVLDTGLEERLRLVSQPDYEGAPMSRNDYTSLMLATVALPIVLLVVAWVML